ncbi:MAG: metallopeptidase TldD-related protein [Planctomycetota bacterium]|jgi:hypothetical protein
MMTDAVTMKRVFVACFVFLPVPVPADGALQDNDVLLRAMVDELDRSMTELVLGDLPRPYFIQYRAQDRLTYTMSAAYGGLLHSNRKHTRPFRSQVRVGSYELDNSNGGTGGSHASLPLDDNYTALRHAMWQATDQDYKRAVEALTRKQAYLKDKNIEDRPDDFSPGKPVVALDPSAEIVFNRQEWTYRVKQLSARFQKYPQIQDSIVDLFAGAVNDHIVNSEGTRLRTADTGMAITITAETQAEEGMLLSDRLEYLAERVEQLPPLDEMLADIDRMCQKLMELRKAPMIEQYTGPILFEPVAAGKVFGALFAEGVCAIPVPLGSRGGQSDRSLEKKLGLRVLPRSFQVYDDPRHDSFEGGLLAGHYSYDDEAVAATRVSIVEDGVLTNLLAGRSPTRKVKQSTGHGRSPGLGRARATVGCLHVSDDDAVTPERLREMLIEAARDEGLAYGLRVESMWSAGYAVLGSPIYAYKVYVEDGREEMVRGLEFLPVRTRILKRILAAGQERQVHNSIASRVTSIIAPAILLEEIELTKFKEEFEKLPILKSPATRE